MASLDIETRLTNLENENVELRKDNAQLKKENLELKKEIAQLKTQLYNAVQGNLFNRGCDWSPNICSKLIKNVQF
jgi:predicted RNase H-like nuclease (RuvC/YqgF family)